MKYSYGPFSFGLLRSVLSVKFRRRLFSWVMFSYVRAVESGSVKLSLGVLRQSGSVTLRYVTLSCVSRVTLRFGGYVKLCYGSQVELRCVESRYGS